MMLLRLTVICTLFALPAFAANPPVPERKEQNLQSLEMAMEKEKEAKAKLSKKVASIEKELDGTRGALVKLAKSMRKNESHLQNLEQEIARLADKQERLTNELQADRKSIARLILGLERIRRTPPEALFIKPGAPYETAQSAMLLGDIIPTINRQAETLKDNLQELGSTTRKLQSEREDAMLTAAKLEDEEKRLDRLLAKRETLFNNANKDLKATQSKIAKIADESKTLKQLMARLEESRTASSGNKNSEAIRNIPVPPPGQPRLPVSGSITIAYDEPDAFGAPSKGLTLQSRSGALVTAPMGGAVRFTGFFKNYGNMVILEHKNGYHSLIAGLEKIDTVVGQNVSSGEPLGRMKRSVTETPRLYYELRYKGNSINPAKRFSGLG